MIYFEEPSGRTISNPSIEYLKKILFESDKNFWSATDEMTLSYRRGNENISLVLIHSEVNNSFYIQYIPNDPKIPDFVAYNSMAAQEELITVYVGGQSHKFSATFFVNAETALEVVDTFIKYEGKMTDRIEWVLKNLALDQEDYDDDEDDDDID